MNHFFTKIKHVMNRNGIIAIAIFTLFLLVFVPLIIISGRDKPETKESSASEVSTTKEQLETKSTMMEESLTQSDNQNSKSTQSNSIKSKSTQPNSTQLNSIQPNTTQPNSTQPNATQSNPKKEDSTISIDTVLNSIVIKNLLTGQTFTGNELYSLTFAWHEVTPEMGFDSNGGLKVISDPYDCILESQETSLINCGYSETGYKIVLFYQWNVIGEIHIKASDYIMSYAQIEPYIFQ